MAELAAASRAENWAQHVEVGDTRVTLEQEMLSGHTEGMKILVAAIAARSILEDRPFYRLFGTRGCAPDEPIQGLSQRILGGAMRSYVAAEYGNLFETHQCRPHANGHTWSPGFGIQAGLLHGHAVAISMGLGAYLGYRQNGLAEARMVRILNALSTDELHETIDAYVTLCTDYPRGGHGVEAYCHDVGPEDPGDSRAALEPVS